LLRGEVCWHSWFGIMRAMNVGQWSGEGCV
jgi:hypothetical protein